MKLVDILVGAAAGKYLLEKKEKQPIVKPITNSTFDMNKYKIGDKK